MLKIGDIDQYLKQVVSRTAYLAQRRIDLFKNLSDLAAYILSHIIRHLDPMGNAVMNDNIRPSRRIADAFDL